MARALKATDPKSAKPSKPKVLVFGAPGVGKTWASLDFPAVYYIDTEGGANLAHYTDKLKKSGGVYFGPEQGANDFPSVIEEVITLATTKHHYKTLVIDSASKLFNSQIAATAESMERAGKKNEFAADKKPAVGLTRRLIRWCDQLDMNVIIICHEKPVWLNGEQIGMTFDFWDKVAYELHLALHIQKAGATRKAKVTKSRLVQFPDADTFEWSYTTFADRYGREVIESESAPISLAKPEQVERYKSLLETIKVPEKVLEKWSENADDISDMTEADLQKRIDYLEKSVPKASAA